MPQLSPKTSVFRSFEEFLQVSFPEYWNRRNIEQPRDPRDAGAAVAIATFRKIRIELPRTK